MTENEVGGREGGKKKFELKNKYHFFVFVFVSPSVQNLIS